MTDWPTLTTLAMFPVLVVMYTRLAVREEREMLAEFGDEYRRYAERTSRFLPRLGAAASTPAASTADGAQTDG